jgi:hypothetical protein
LNPKLAGAIHQQVGDTGAGQQPTELGFEKSHVAMLCSNRKLKAWGACFVDNWGRNCTVDKVPLN